MKRVFEFDATTSCILPLSMSTIEEFFDSQEQLVKAASSALPHSFSHCTYNLGQLRQPIYLCLTCAEENPDAEPAGICSACSIACHTSHEQLELFAKRDFRCDCPTARLGHPCSLPPSGNPKAELNTSNAYGPNFKRVFCRCGRPYDPHSEKETMVQCLACEVSPIIPKVDPC